MQWQQILKDRRVQIGAGVLIIGIAAVYLWKRKRKPKLELVPATPIRSQVSAPMPPASNNPAKTEASTASNPLAAFVAEKEGPNA